MLDATVKAPLPLAEFKIYIKGKNFKKNISKFKEVAVEIWRVET